MASYAVKHSACPVCGSHVEAHYEAVAGYHLVAYALNLTPQVGAVMALLMSKPVATHHELLASMALLGQTDEHSGEHLKVAIARLRKQLGNRGWSIRNIYRLGYSLDADARAEAHRIIEAAKADFEMGKEREAVAPPTRSEVWNTAEKS